jgi:hypothetical protein
MIPPLRSWRGERERPGEVNAEQAMANGFVEQGPTQHRGEPTEQPDQPGPPAMHMVLAA